MTRIQVLFAIAAMFFVLAVSAIVSPPCSAQLRITFPANDARVSGEVIELTGVGADPQGQLEVSILTNRWWVQNGSAVINPDGSWSYAPCYLSGQGQYNNHTIRVTIIRNGSRSVSASVRGVVRR